MSAKKTTCLRAVCGGALWVFILVGGVVSAGAAPTGPATVAVGKIKVNAAVAERAEAQGRRGELAVVLQTLEGQFINALNETRKFQVVNRHRRDELMKEQAFASSGNVDTDDPNAAQMGKMAGAKYLLLPEIYDFQDGAESIRYQTVGKQANRRVVLVKIRMDIDDATTGKILETAKVQVKKLKSSGGDSFGSGGGDDLLTEAAEDMALRLCRRVVEVIFPARVLSKIGNQVTLNRGDGTGIKKGDFYEVFGLGEELVDPDTGKSLGRDEVKVGEVKISRVLPDKSNGEVVGEDLGVAKGCVVRAKLDEFEATDQRVENASPQKSGVAPGGAPATKDW